MKSTLDLEKALKPTTMRCARCGGTLHIIPIKIDLGKNRFRIETMNICRNCTFAQHQSKEEK
jgi:uncharacterized protein with PIN domain